MTGGTASDSLGPDIEATVSIGPFTGPGFTGGRTTDIVRLDLTANGRYDIFFDAVRVAQGETYGFAVRVTNCPTWLECQNKPLTGVDTPLTLEYTTTDAYLDGYAGYNYGDRAGPDIRFEATFSVPEPGSLLLLLTGLCGLALVAVRRRRRVDP